jgi:DNA ligase (NAD+)
MGYPIDGMVITYDDVKYGESLGYTGHHPKHSIAYKFYDEEVETTLKHIEWTVGKTEVLTPVAVFEPVEIDGTIVERASVHNVSILRELDLCEGDAITVYKANQIIPQVSDNLSKNHRESTLTIPNACPICGFKTIETRNNNSTVLRCINPSCKGQLLGKLTHFCSRNAMNIEGLSESTLEKFIELNYINSFEDIYNLDDFYYDIIEQDGFGKKSVDKLMSAIENSKKTTLDRFLYALSIPNVGRTASKTISKRFDNSFEKFYNETILKCFNFETLDGFGSELHYSINEYIAGYDEDIVKIAEYLVFENEKNDSGFSADLTGKTFVITGSLDCFENRNKLKEVIESLGGKVSGSVSKKTNYLVNNDVDSASSKNKKAKELGIEIITEKTLMNMLEQ